MKIMKKIMFVALSIAVLAGCVQKENIAPEQKSDNKIRLTISLDFPQSSPDSKVALGYSDTTLTWTGDETLSVLVGKKETTTTSAAAGLQIPLQSIAPGVFSGEIDLKEFTVDDIQGISVPAENGTFFAYNSNSYRIIMPIAATQTQSVSGVFNPVYVPFFSRFTVDSLGVADASGAYKVSDLQLYSGTDLLRFNIYGANPQMEADEVLKSIKVIASDKIVGQSRWTLDQDGLGSGGNSYVIVNYEGGETIADKTKENGIHVFASVILGGARTFSKIEVTTDKGVYLKEISNKISETTSRHSLKVHPIGINLAGFSRVGDVQYSVDGGSNWGGELPAELNGNLAVKTTNGCLTSDGLAAIKKLIDAQSSPVDLDLSQATYVSATFPAAFKATSSAKNTTLKSIKFPSNVKEIAESAFEYCSALESVTLDGITTINTQAFYYSGLKTLNVPKSVTSLPGLRAFGCCSKLSEVFFDSPAKQIGGNGSSGTNHTTFAYTNASNGQIKISDAVDCVFTFGPNSAAATRYFFRYNTGIKKIVFQKKISIVNYCIQHMTDIHTFDLSTITSVPSNSYASYWANVGKNQLINGVECKILVPKGTKDAYAAKQPWKDLITNTYDTGKKDEDGNAIKSNPWVIVEVE